MRCIIKSFGARGFVILHKKKQKKKNGKALKWMPGVKNNEIPHFECKQNRHSLLWCIGKSIYFEVGDLSSNRSLNQTKNLK